MAIYVDPLFTMESQNAQAFQVGERHGHRWCHFFSDFASLPELHKVAAAIGMRRAWFDDDDADGGHYDLTPPKRAAAIQAGAVEVDRRRAVDIWAWSRLDAWVSGVEQRWQTQAPRVALVICPYVHCGSSIATFPPTCWRASILGWAPPTESLAPTVMQCFPGGQTPLGLRPLQMRRTFEGTEIALAYNCAAAPVSVWPQEMLITSGTPAAAFEQHPVGWALHAFKSWL